MQIEAKSEMGFFRIILLISPAPPSTRVLKVLSFSAKKSVGGGRH